ncbi:glycosyltransferase family 1 protein [Nodosilinea sp. FACHB-13]|uniref:glycosyltransferase family 1 protein n=1 Tax=Cyanophyceae TaxID=3028117 RepID=UPI001687FC8A|nr:glycosyltransferase family 1 protein [Nodosilinea sp. FACHB-13]MBD2108635.1 glycosyltransferase family 1 protein [Nodosilinea sp. FACHB-13]
MSTHYISESYFNRKLSDKKSIEDQLSLEQSAASLGLRWPEGTELEPSAPGAPDLICFSHLRWDFVYQRPQHLLNRCAQTRRVFIVEEPIAVSEETSYLDISKRDCGVWIVVPHLSESLSDEEFTLSLQQLLNTLFAEAQIQQPILWYYTPMAVPFTHHLPASAVVYDCMDELSAFKGAHPQLQAWEARLFEMADLVFTGGHSLYEAKQHQHSSVHAFPSSIDAAHFAQARQPLPEPHDQAEIPHPRMGFYGVIDERLDLELLDGIAQARPDWHLVMVGPVVKIDSASLPQRPNIHYLGGKSYQELPHYLAGWDVALLLFARNESTRFISPTKTPEYLAGGKPVVSTSIRDVVRPYGDENLVHIADTVPEFVEAIAAALAQSQAPSDWLDRVDARLAQTSWDLTWQAMNDRIEEAIAANARKTTPSETTSVKTKYPTAIAANVDQVAI